MFAGKTIALMAEIDRHKSAGHAVEVLTHAIDNRHRAGNIATHDGDIIGARAVSAVTDLPGAIESSTSILAIDEAQFFGPDLLATITDLVTTGRHVIISGLSVTFDGRPFEPIPALMALSDRVDKFVARCSICDGPAPYHQPLEQAFLTDPLTIRSEQIGGSDIYQARCRRHFTNHPA